MSKKEKRKWGDRKDAYLVRDADPLHNIMNNLMGTRTENEAVVRFEIELSNLKTYLENKNKDCTDKRFRYTFFHAVLAAFARTLDERKRLNYFVRKKKFYMRREISFSYIAKKYKADGAEECVVIQRYKPESEISAIQQIHDKTCKEVNELRETQSKGTDTDKIIKTVLKLPSFVISSFFVLLRALDRCGRVPMFFYKLIPYYSTMFCANLGSIKLNSEYHHLINFGTNSIFAVIGEITRKPELNPDGSFCGFKEYIPITFTVDERIADGVYYANSIDMIKKLLAKPELLDLPANQKLNPEKIYNRGNTMTIKNYSKDEIKIAPWLKVYGEVPFHVEYPDVSMVGALMASAKKYPESKAITFQNKTTVFGTLLTQIKQTAKAFAEIGIKEGDFVTVCMPNTPQAILCLYAINYIGAIASMIHPLSATKEIEFYISETKSKTIITIDQFYHKIVEAKKNIELQHIIIARISDALPFVKKIAYRFIKERKFQPKVVEDNVTIKWNSFYNLGKNSKKDPYIEKKSKDLAVILFSGGTTGKNKGIMLTNGNFNACALQTMTMCHKEVIGAKMLAAMPIFHGFGLGVCIHTMMYAGGESILVPQVSVKGYSQLLKTAQPNYIAGVPTLYEGITRNKDMDGVDLSCLRGVFSGGDSLSIELKKKIDKFLKDHGSTVNVREGYGTTECVTASCLTPYNKEKEGSIGLPYPDTYYCIVKPGTTEEVPYGTEGEICLRGPSVMMGYLNNEKETQDTLKVHADGYTWLHTGDVGIMDEEGFIFFKQRIKRMIVTSGYNVYPSQIENILDSLEEVQMSCVIGVPDSYKIHKVKAFVVLRTGIEESEDLKNKIMNLCKANVAKYAMPYDIEFRKELPKTLVGKIAYRELEAEEEKKINSAKTTL